MITTSSKWFFGLSLYSFVLAAAYGWTTGGNGLGPVSLGYKGGVGDHLGYGILISVGAIALVLGLLAVATRDADADALAQLAGTDVVPAAVAPVASHFPIIGAFGAAVTAIGVVVSPVLVAVGLVICVGALIEWMVLAWSDRASGDPETNRALRDRIMAPFEVPLLGFVGIGVLVIALSRILLTSSRLGAVWVAATFAVVVLLVGALIASRPKISSNLIAGLLVVAALGTLAGGIAAASRGERHFETHEEEQEEEQEAEGQEGEEPEIRVQIPGASGIGESSDDAEPPTPPTTEAPEEGAA